MVFRDTIWRSHYLGIYKILYAAAYLGASCRAGNAHISTIWGSTAQKRPCNPQENSAGHRGHFQQFIEGYGITGPVHQALGPSHTATRMRHYANFRAARCSSQPGTHPCRAAPAPPHGEMKRTCRGEHIEQRDGHAEAGRALTAAMRMQRHTDPRADARRAYRLSASGSSSSTISERECTPVLSYIWRT